jgi:hypothetical protein
LRCRIEFIHHESDSRMQPQVPSWLTAKPGSVQSEAKRNRVTYGG